MLHQPAPNVSTATFVVVAILASTTGRIVLWDVLVPLCLFAFALFGFVRWISSRSYSLPRALVTRCKGGRTTIQAPILRSGSKCTGFNLIVGLPLPRVVSLAWRVRYIERFLLLLLLRRLHARRALLCSFTLRRINKP